jgi:uncharacterized surface protein with fasciclin (FAS1) repeats
MRRIIIGMLAMSLLLVAALPAAANPNRAPAPGPDTIATVATGAGFSELVGALVYVDGELGTNLVELFSTPSGQYTVFAPTNDAFETLLGPGGEISDLPAEVVLDVLLYHVVEGRRAANSVVPRNGERTITTLLGQTFSVNTDLEIDAFGNGAKIGPANISASNGVIHVIDTVILPDLS